MLQNLKSTVSNLYQQYELITCVYMFEPWEKKLINTFVLFILALVLFSSYMYLPTYVQTLLHFISPLTFDRKSNHVYAPVLQANNGRGGF